MSGADAPTIIQPPAPVVEPVRVSAHPRARRSVRRVRAAAGLVVLVVVIALSLRAGLPAWDAVARALACAVGAHFAAWALALAIWRQLVLAELELARQRHEERKAEARAEAERLAAERAAAAKG